MAHARKGERVEFVFSQPEGSSDFEVRFEMRAGMMQMAMLTEIDVYALYVAARDQLARFQKSK